MVVQELSKTSGIPEHVLRLLLSLLAGYVIAVVYRVLFRSKHVKTSAQVWPQHIYSVITGLALSYFNYGWDTAHFLLIITVSWLLLRFMGPTVIATASVFLWTFGYLLIAYYIYATDDYDVNWTTSYCVMCLRLIGFAFDYYDGARLVESRNVTKKPKTSESDGVVIVASEKPSMPKLAAVKSHWDDVELFRLPSLLETFGYCFFFAGFLVGPQFPFVCYEKFVTMKVFETSSAVDGVKDNKKSGLIVNVPSCWGYAIRCFILGVIYMALTHVGQQYFPTHFLLTRKFANEFSFWERVGYMTLAGRIVLIKYLGVWLVNEVSCVIVGISYNGTDPKTGKPRWSDLANVNPYTLETLTSLQQVVESFNMNTNLWCKKYIFKRLRFLNSKELSGLGTLLFLAIWHGFAPAYFAVFLMEFADMEAERRMRSWMSPVWSYLASGGVFKSTLWYFGCFMCYLLTNASLSYATTAFDHLQWHKVKTSWGTVYWWCTICVVFVVVLDPIIKSLSPGKGKKSAVKASETKTRSTRSTSPKTRSTNPRD